MNGRAGIAAVAVVGAVALARFAPEAVRIEYDRTSTGYSCSNASTGVFQLLVMWV